MTTALFSPITLRGLTIENRVVVGPMDQYSAIDGNAGDWHLMHLGKFAVSGAGLIITESAAVEERGRITHGCLGLYSDENEASLNRIVRFCREHGTAKLGVQLAHSGRKGSTLMPWEGRAAPLTEENGVWPTVGCAGQPRAEGWPVPVPLDRAGLDRVRDAHVAAVERAARIGFDLVELVMAHGYLLQEFLSPLSNLRDDACGGDLAGRMRYPLEVFDAMRAVWPADKPMGVRVSATDWVDGGWSLPDTVVLARALKARGCDYMAVSSGGLSLDQKIPVGEGHQVAFSAKVKRETDMPTMTMGMIHDPRHAERIVADGEADFVALARAMLSDPHWPWYAAAVLDAEIQYPRQYLRGYLSRWHRTKRMGDKDPVS
jgi:2,4-dienoyl-CoA reductase-like NADH-dependent reductase (Old Yellow Enzyme family)